MDEIPDIGILSNNIIDIIEYIDNNLDEKLEILRDILIDKYEQIPISIIKLLTSTRDKKIQAENIKYLLELLDNLQKVKNGKLSIEDCKEIFSTTIAERYIYPTFGSKENFEKHILQNK